MNIRILRTESAFAGTTLALLLCHVAASWAGEQGTLMTRLEDPLLTRPEALRRGVILPGDSMAIQCPASSDVSGPLGLSAAVDVALCNNPQVKATWAAVKGQAAAVGEARAAYLPTISATVNQMQTRTGYPGTPDPATSVVGNSVYGLLNWRLFDFGARAANREAANSLLLAALANQDATLQKVLAAVISAYFEVQSARAAWHSKEEGEAIAKHTLEGATRREANGALGRSDTLQATTALARATLDKNRSFGNYQKAIAVLTYALGVPMEANIALADEADDDDHSGYFEAHPVAGGGSSSLAGWLQEADRSHPAILAARAQLKAAQSRVASTRAEGLPTVDFAANYYKNGYPGQALTSVSSHITTLGVSVTVPIFDGFSHSYKVRGAQAQAEQREAELTDIEHDIQMEIVKAHADVNSALENLKASHDLFSAAQEALVAARRKYELGAVDILSLLSTQSALADARQERVRCVAEWRSARLRLLANGGLLGRLAVGEGVLQQSAPPRQ
jgi:outer membrane protein